jgi:hypothetical protein
MVSFTALAATAAVAANATTNAGTKTLAEGAYFRPPMDQVSGVPGNTNAPYRRTPCPALNALANHGYLPRDGKNITNTQLRDVVMDKFNLDLALTSLLVGVLPATFDLNLLGTHGLVEHDASLVHADAHFGADPSKTDAKLLADVLARASATKPFTVETFGQIRKERLVACKTSNPNCKFAAQETFLAFGETALALNGFGDAKTETLDKATFTSFFELEKIPDGFKKPALITRQSLGATSAKVQAIATAA